MDKNGRITWADGFSIGDSKIDNDHKNLIGIINDMIELVELDKDREEFAMILSRMTDYSLSHFKKEEDFMKRFAYPKLIRHHNYHSNFIYKVAIFNSELLSQNPPDPIEIIDFLKKWWKNHILVIDKDYKAYKDKIQSDVTYD